MKRLFLILGFFIMILLSCNEKKKDIKAFDQKAVEVSKNELTLGETLFKDRTCSNCHDMNDNTVGPSIKEMAMVYKQENADMVAFLKGNEHPIVVKDSNEVAAMKVNIESFIKGLSDQELQALSHYILNANE